jgi:hypothetical protein
MVSAITGIVRYRRHDKNVRLFIWYLCLVFLVESFNVYKSIRVENNKWIYHFYGPIEYALLIIVLSSWIEQSKFRTALRSSIIVFIIIGIINGVHAGGLSTYNYLPVSISYPIFAGISAYVLLKILKGDWGDVWRKPIFWICSALLLISSCNIVYFSFQEIINRYHLVWPWVLHNIVSMLTYILYTIGLVVKPRVEASEYQDSIINSKPKAVLDLDDLDL